MNVLCKGNYLARIAKTAQELQHVQRIRFMMFSLNKTGGQKEGLDQDQFDETWQHMLVEDVRTSEIVACFRYYIFENGHNLSHSYSKQYYDLSSLSRYNQKMLELGRFCISPAHTDPDILRVAWGALTRVIKSQNIQLLFGCSSFSGTSTQFYKDTFALLKDRHLAPAKWSPKMRAPDVFEFAEQLMFMKPNLKRAMKQMPSLLRTYLMMGGWVSDHAVIDRELNTIHVFTGVEISAIPKERVKRLQVVAA